MDCLPLGVHAFLVPLLFCVLNSVTCQPFMQGQRLYPRPFPQMQQRFTLPGMYDPFNSFQRMGYWNDWNQQSNYISRNQLVPTQYAQNRRARQQLNDMQPRDKVRPLPRLPVRQPVQTQQKPSYVHSGRRTHTPIVKSIQTHPTRVVTRAPTIQPRNRTSRRKQTVVTGILSNVMPHPKQRIYDRMSAKKRARFRAVAKAKSFPRIIKDTALENKLSV